MLTASEMGDTASTVTRGSAGAGAMEVRAHRALNPSSHHPPCTWCRVSLAGGLVPPRNAVGWVPMLCQAAASDVAPCMLAILWQGTPGCVCVGACSAWAVARCVAGGVCADQSQAGEHDVLHLSTSEHRRKHCSSPQASICTSWQLHILKTAVLVVRQHDGPSRPMFRRSCPHLPCPQHCMHADLCRNEQFSTPYRPTSGWA